MSFLELKFCKEKISRYYTHTHTLFFFSFSLSLSPISLVLLSNSQNFIIEKNVYQRHFHLIDRGWKVITGRSSAFLKNQRHIWVINRTIDLCPGIFTISFYKNILPIYILQKRILRGCQQNISRSYIWMA